MRPTTGRRRPARPRRDPRGPRALAVGVLGAAALAGALAAAALALAVAPSGAFAGPGFGLLSRPRRLVARAAEARQEAEGAAEQEQRAASARLELWRLRRAASEGETRGAEEGRSAEEVAEARGQLEASEDRVLKDDGRAEAALEAAGREVEEAQEGSALLADLEFFARAQGEVEDEAKARALEGLQRLDEDEEDEVGQNATAHDVVVQAASKLGKEGAVARWFAKANASGLRLDHETFEVVISEAVRRGAGFAAVDAWMQRAREAEADLRFGSITQAGLDYGDEMMTRHLVHWDEKVQRWPHVASSKRARRDRDAKYEAERRRRLGMADSDDAESNIKRTAAGRDVDMSFSYDPATEDLRQHLTRDSPFSGPGGR